MPIAASEAFAAGKPKTKAGKPKKEKDKPKPAKALEPAAAEDLFTKASLQVCMLAAVVRAHSLQERVYYMAMLMHARLDREVTSKLDVVAQVGRVSQVEEFESDKLYCCQVTIGEGQSKQAGLSTCQAPGLDRDASSAGSVCRLVHACLDAECMHSEAQSLSCWQA